MSCPSGVISITSYHCIRSYCSIVWNALMYACACWNMCYTTFLESLSIFSTHDLDIPNFTAIPFVLYRLSITFRLSILHWLCFLTWRFGRLTHFLQQKEPTARFGGTFLRLISLKLSSVFSFSCNFRYPTPGSSNRSAWGTQFFKKWGFMGGKT